MVTDLKINMENAWGLGYDRAVAGGSEQDCPVDPTEEPETYSEWMAGFEDGKL
jgi:ribosome modulation factor